MRRYAPEWSDAAASALISRLHTESKGKISGYVGNWLTNPIMQDKTLTAARLSPADRDLARRILAFYSGRLQSEEGRHQAIVKAFLKPLRERRAYRGKPRQLVVAPATTGPRTFHVWLADDPSAERQRDISKSPRILSGLRGWPLQWMTTAGVVCYERAAGRLRQERGGRLEEAFVRGLVRTKELATATANSSDHYVLIPPGGEPRFLTVEEVMRAFGVPSDSPLWHAPPAAGGRIIPSASGELPRA